MVSAAVWWLCVWFRGLAALLFLLPGSPCAFLSRGCLQQFWSPLTNRRTDRYGLDRQLLPVQVTRAVRAAIPPEMPLFVRLRCGSVSGGGFVFSVWW